MKHKRRTKALSALLSLALLLSLLPGTAWAGTVPEEPTVIQMDGETLKKGDEAWTADDALALPAGSYRLDSDITTDKTISVSDEVTLDLNGFGILYTGNGNASVITVGSGATLTLMDTAAVERIHKITLTNGRGTAVETVETAETDDATTKYVTGGYITGGTGIKNGDSSYGGGVYVGSGTFNMSGGTISGNIVYGYNSPSLSGGGVYVGSGTFTMSGGTISGNIVYGVDSSSYGGGVYVGSGTFNMSVGTISDNTAYGGASRGGGVYVDGSAKFTMSGGTISGNIASAYYSYGGGVYVGNSATFTMSGGTISDNTALYNYYSGEACGGGVFSRGTFNMSDGTISGNKASGNGGGVYVGSGTFTMSGGTISGNKASGDYSRGGGVYVKGGGTFNMSGGTISSNTAGYLGGGVYVDGSAEFTMSGGTISGNTADYGGGGVFVWDGPTFTMSSGTISDNKADSGGGVFFYGSAEFTMSGGSVTGNSADYAGGVYANSNNQIITISGAPEITGNTDAVAGENTPSNLFLENDGGLPIIDAKGLTGLTDAKIGVSVYDDGNKSTYPDVFTQPFEEHDDAAAVKGCFTSDRENYAVVVTEENELMLTWLDTVTPSVTMTHGTVTAKPALPGKTVTLNVQPDSGYRLKSGSLKVLQYTQAIKQGDVLTYEQIKSLVDANYTEDRLRVSYPRNTAYFILTSGSEEPDAWYKCGSSGLLSNNGTIPEGVTNTKLWLCSFSFPGGNFSKFSPFTEPADVAGTPIRQGKIVTFAEIEKAMEDTNTAYFVSSYEDTEASATKYMFDEGNGWIVTPGSNSTYSDKEALSSHDWLYLREADGYTFIAVDAISLTLDGYTFTMPDRPVTVFAEFEPAPADSDDDDPPPVTVPATNDTDSVAVSATVSGSTASVSTPSAAQLEQIVSESARDGGVTFDVSALNRTINSVSIPTATVKAVEQAVSEAASETAGLTVKLSGGAVSFDAQALTAITEQTSGSSIQFSLEDIGEKRLNSTQQNATSDMDVQAVYDAYMTSNGKRISDFKGGKATVTVPYALKNGQSRNGIAVWYIADDGSKTEMPSVYDGKDVRFTVEHFSNYVIAYDAERAAACPQDDSCPMSSFTDLNPALWYHDGIHFCLENGLMKGVGNDKFNPGGTTSRGMIVTILYRLEGEPKVTAENPFTDVEDGQWYADAVIWAAGNDIVSGYGGGKFGPNDNITREQLATILYRYAQSKGQGFEGSWMFLLDYPDASEVSSWADEAMHWMVMNGIINGKDGKLVPGGNASRAEAATMLQRFCENVAE